MKNSMVLFSLTSVYENTNKDRVLSRCIKSRAWRVVDVRPNKRRNRAVVISKANQCTTCRRREQTFNRQLHLEAFRGVAGLT